MLSRLLAATLGYYFGFMIVSLVMVGLGAGALFVQQATRLFTAERALRHAAVGSALTGAMMFVGSVAMIVLYPTIYTMGTMHPLVLGAIFWCFFPLYFAGGTVVSLLLMHARGNFYRLYTVDLLGAAVGAVLAVLSLEAMVLAGRARAAQRAPDRRGGMLRARRADAEARCGRDRARDRGRAGR